MTLAIPLSARWEAAQEACILVLAALVAAGVQQALACRERVLLTASASPVVPVALVAHTVAAVALAV